jgi:hypothetical protein
MNTPRNHESTKQSLYFSCFRVFVALAALAAGDVVRAQTDLDAFMKQVLARRDDNWKKLQQYVLDERQTVHVQGPGRVPLWGERREYTWYIRDGFFVQSPLSVNGVAIGEADRQKYEADFLRRAKEREKRGQRGQISISPTGVAVQPADEDPVLPVDSGAPANVDGILKQTRQPQFISSAYFLRFKFEEGKYALVGRETLDVHDTLRIEYYPAKMFGGTDRRRTGNEPSATEKARDAEFQRLMNKVALITLWVEPSAHQIVKYTFDNIAFDFLPAQWLVHIDDLKASMTMSQPFADLKNIWLPQGMELSAAMTLAVGQFDVHYGLDYSGYRRPDVSSKVGVKDR